MCICIIEFVVMWEELEDNGYFIYLVLLFDGERKVDFVFLEGWVVMCVKFFDEGFVLEIEIE